MQTKHNTHERHHSLVFSAPGLRSVKPGEDLDAADLGELTLILQGIQQENGQGVKRMVVVACMEKRSQTGFQGPERRGARVSKNRDFGAACLECRGEAVE